MQKGDKLELFVEKLVFEGSGLARYEDKIVFVEGTAPQEKVLAQIISVNKNFARAKLLEVKEPSKYRVKPFCALASVCGGCCWQHVDYQEQLRQKKQIVEETLRKIAGEEYDVRDVIASPQITEFRHKVQYPVSQTKVSKRLLAGYYKKNTHELVNIKFCPIQPDIINKITEYIRQEIQNYPLDAYDERKHKGLLRHIIFRHSLYDNTILVTFVVNAEQISEGLKQLAKSVFDKFADIIGCTVNYNTKRTNAILGNRGDIIIGQGFYHEKLGDKLYQISAGSFFQVNPQAALNILNTVKSMIMKEVNAPSILDAYSGVGSFGIFLGDIAKNVTCVEDYPPATADAVENVKLNNYDNFEILTGDAKVQLDNLLEQKKCFEVVIVDPPRRGLASEAIKTAAQLSKKIIIYVSCNPTTLARDLKLFKTEGFEVSCVQPVDMFCHTYHIENVALLKKCKS